MLQCISRTIVILLAGAVVSLTPVLAQSSVETTRGAGATRNWEEVPTAFTTKGRLFVITADQPHRRQTYHVQSLTAEKLVCRFGIGRTHTYLPEQIAVLIVPGDRVLTIRLFTGFNAGLGASIWGTVALAAACPICAAGTAVAAFLFFDCAGATLFTGSEPERLIYLAPGQDESEVKRLLHVPSFP